MAGGTVGALDAALTQALHDLRPRDGVIVGMKQDTRDRRLNGRRLRRGKQPGERFQTFGVGDVLAGKCIERPNLHLGVVQLGDVGRDDANLLRFSERAMAEINLGDLELRLARTRKDGQNAGPRVRAPQASENCRLTDRPARRQRRRDAG